MAKTKEEILKEFIERGAELEHQRWAKWQKYMFSKCKKQGGALIIPEWAVERWSRQINTPYTDLSEKEKESDRKEVKKYIPLLSQALGRAEKNGFAKALKKFGGTP